MIIGKMKYFIGKMLLSNQIAIIHSKKSFDMFSYIRILSLEKWNSMGIMKNFTGKMVWINEIEIIRIGKIFWYV
jgi:hypothetical protein